MKNNNNNNNNNNSNNNNNNNSCVGLRYANFKMGWCCALSFVKYYKFLWPLEGLNGKPLACKSSYIMLNSLKGFEITKFVILVQE